MGSGSKKIVSDPQHCLPVSVLVPVHNLFRIIAAKCFTAPAPRTPCFPRFLFLTCWFILLGFWSGYPLLAARLHLFARILIRIPSPRCLTSVHLFFRILIRIPSPRCLTTFIFRILIRIPSPRCSTTFILLGFWSGYPLRAARLHLFC
jgi:hypothetical protein